MRTPLASIISRGVLAIALTLTVACKEKTRDEGNAGMLVAAPTDVMTSKAAGPPTVAENLPAECGNYKAMIEKLASCDKMRQSSRDALRRGYDAISRSWTNIGSQSAEATKVMADRCKQGMDTTKQAAGTMCVW
jgi:hypothetical protein